jgi:hypothetical protein
VKAKGKRQKLRTAFAMYNLSQRSASFFNLAKASAFRLSSDFEDDFFAFCLWLLLPSMLLFLIFLIRL